MVCYEWQVKKLMFATVFQAIQKGTRGNEIKKLEFWGFTYICEKQARFGSKVVVCLFVFHLEDRFIYLKCQIPQLTAPAGFKLEFPPSFLVPKCKQSVVDRISTSSYSNTLGYQTDERKGWTKYSSSQNICCSWHQKEMVKISTSQGSLSPWKTKWYQCHKSLHVYLP